MHIIKLTETDINKAVKNVLVKEDFDRDDVIDIAKKDKDFEKRVKEIAADVVSELFRILWQRKAFYDEIKR